MYKDPSQFWEQVDIEGPVSTSTNSFCNKNQPFWNKHMILLKSNLTAVVGVGCRRQKHLFMEEILPPSCYGKYLNVHIIKDFILYWASYMPGGGGFPWEHPSTVCVYSTYV